MFHPDQSNRHLSDTSTLSDRKASGGGGSTPYATPAWAQEGMQLWAPSTAPTQRAALQPGSWLLPAPPSVAKQ